jgi:coenzyme Q-binding protein COQ10
MFDVVADVERYPEFLPLCEGLEIESRTNGQEKSVLVATMTVGYGALHETFTSRVTLEPSLPAIGAATVSGPFRHLDNRWRFLPAPGGAEIEFFIDYEFRSRLNGLLVGALFDNAIRRYAEAFEARAHVVYGTRSCDGRERGLLTR